MRKLLSITMGLLITISIYGQRNENQEYWNTWEYTAKDGMQQKFEEAAAKKTAMFNKTPETGITTYRIVTGSNSGTYVRIESRKSPDDYDKDRTDEVKYWQENVGKYVAKYNGQVRWQRFNSGSYNYDPENTTPAKFVQRITFNVKADKILHFRRRMNRIAKVAEKQGWDSSRLLFRLVSGGNRNQFVLAITHNTYKRAERPENETSFEDDYNKLFGWGSNREDGQNFNASLESWGERVETLVLIPEISTGMMK